MTREPLPPRREGVTMDLAFAMADGNETRLAVTYGFNAARRVREVFCLPLKSGTDLQSLLHQACMAISLGLQHGATMAELRHTLGEEHDALAPRSIVGLIVREGAALDAEERRADVIRVEFPAAAAPATPAGAESDGGALSTPGGAPRESAVAVDRAPRSPAAGSYCDGGIQDGRFTGDEIEAAVAEAVCAQCGKPRAACLCIPDFLRRAPEHHEVAPK